MSLSALNSQVYQYNNSINSPKLPEKINDKQSEKKNTTISVKTEIKDFVKTGATINEGTAKSSVNFISTPSETKKITAATQTALKVSSSNGLATSLGLSAGGALIGVAVAKIAGKKVLPIALLGSSVGSIVDRSIGLARNTDKIKDSYKTGKTDATKFETAINAVGFALDIGSISAAGKLLKASEKTIKIASESGTPLSEGLRQYKNSENLVGKAGEAWEHSHTVGIPTPNQLAKWKGAGNITGAEAFLNKADNMKLQGSKIQDIVSKIPKEAQLRELTPSPTIKEGFEYAWVDKKTNMDYRVRIHGADSGVALHNPTSTAAQGWIVRVERNPVGQRLFPKTEYLTLDGTYHKASDLMQIEKKKKDAELAIAVIKDYQTIGQASFASASNTVGPANFLGLAMSQKEESLQLANKVHLGEEVEHFHHSTHIAVGDFNKALKPN